MNDLSRYNQSLDKALFPTDVFTLVGQPCSKCGSEDYELNFWRALEVGKVELGLECLGCAKPKKDKVRFTP
jgi:hypothetical protein